MTIKYFLQSKKNPAPIYVRLRDANTDAKARTKWSINPNDWSKSKGQLKNLKDEDFKLLKEDMDEFKRTLNKEINKLPNEQLPTTKWLKAIINPQIEEQENKIPNNIIDYIEYFIKKKGSEASHNSIKKYRVIKHKLEKLELQLGNSILIKDIGEDFKSDFVKFSKSLDYGDRTIHRELGFIKSFCKHARHNGINTHFQLDDLKYKFDDPTEKIYLDFEELAKIEQTELTSDSLKNARDWLLISCYTGQRISDFMNFTKEMVRVVDGKKLIAFRQQKTKKEVELALHPKVIEILNKNNGDFPYKIADQNYNEYIKEVCKTSGLIEKVKGRKMVNGRKQKGIYPKYELISSHVGRRSFATNFYGKKIPTPLLMNATGHSTEKMFLEYIGKSNTQKALDLANYF